MNKDLEKLYNDLNDLQNKFSVKSSIVKILELATSCIENTIKFKTSEVICSALNDAGIKAAPSDVLFTKEGIWIAADSGQILDRLSGERTMKQLILKNKAGFDEEVCDKRKVHVTEIDYEYKNDNSFYSYDEGKCYYMFPGQKVKLNNNTLQWLGRGFGFKCLDQGQKNQ